MRVLMLEEDMSLSKEIANLLTEHNYQCDVVGNVKDAQYYFDIRNYDLLLLAWPSSTPQTRLNVISEIKKVTPKTSVIVISERLDKESEIEALRSGADDYIRKPLDN